MEHGRLLSSQPGARHPRVFSFLRVCGSHTRFQAISLLIRISAGGVTNVQRLIPAAGHSLNDGVSTPTSHQSYLVYDFQPYT